MATRCLPFWSLCIVHSYFSQIQPLLRDSPVKVQKYVLRQFAQLLPHDVEARRAFVQNGGLQFLQVCKACGSMHSTQSQPSFLFRTRAFDILRREGRHMP